MTAREEMEAALEAVLFASGDPVPRTRLLEIFDQDERGEAAAALDAVLARYAPGDGRGVMASLMHRYKYSRERAVDTWLWSNRNMERAIDHYLTPHQVFRLRHEDLCADPVGVTRRVAAFLGLPVPQSAVEFLSGFTNPEKIHDYRVRKPERIQAVEERIGPVLERFGYRPGDGVAQPARS